MICFIWDGFPQYAARCVGNLVAQINETVVVVATRPKVPIQGMDRLAKCRVVWIDVSESRSLQQIVGEWPRILFVSGWGNQIINRLRDGARAAGVRIAAMCDNNFNFTVKEFAKAILFRFLYRNKFDAYLVPGESSRRLLRFYGVSDTRIFTGLYAADDSLFHDGKPLLDRPKQLIFVGQLCERKNVLRLASTFVMANSRKEWKLIFYGCGPLEQNLKYYAQRFGQGMIDVNPFMQPEELAQKYRESRIFCLPSIEEHWGVVVHEAALSGCILLLSRDVGAKDDFLIGGVNGSTFASRSSRSMLKSMLMCMSFDGDKMWKAHDASIKKSALASTTRFSVSVKEIIRLLSDVQ